MQVFTQRVPRESANFFPPFLVYRYLYMHVHVHTEATYYMAKYVCIHIIHNTMRVTMYNYNKYTCLSKTIALHT